MNDNARFVISIIVAVLAVCLIGQNARADKQEDAIQIIENIGGKFEFQEITGKKQVVAVNLGGTLVKDESLEYLVNFPHLTTVDLFMTGITDKGLAHLERLPRLHVLLLFHTAISDTGVARLCARQKHLRILDLRNTSITDACLDDIGKLQDLAWLYLDNVPPEVTRGNLPGLEYLKNVSRKTRITDAGVKRLAKLDLLRLTLGGTNVSDECLPTIEKFSRLRDLGLDYTAVTDAGLVHLSAMENLCTLQLNNTKITDQGLKHLSKLKNLTYLNIRRNQIRDPGLAALGGLDKLEMVFLEDTPVTDAAIPHLAKLKSLQKVALEGTKVTDEGVTALRKALPAAEIRTGPSPSKSL